jgi:glucosamine--fructose-6-phosphate aminotransferase (isomerizing)
MTTRLENEIAEQPEVLQRLLDDERSHIAQIARAIRDAQPRYVVIVARGTSDNAARYAQYTLGALTGLTVGLAAPSLTTIYQRTPRFDGALVIGISQSGRSIEPARVLEEAKERGAVMTLSITNDAESPLAQIADHHIPLQAGPERSLAATKTYTAQLMAIALLAAELSGSSEWDDALQRVPVWMRETFGMNAHTREAAARYTFMSHCVTLARGFNYCTGFELALKLKELTYVVAEAYSSADFHHGPKAIVQPGFPLIAIAPEGEALHSMSESLQTFRESGADLTIISNSPEVLRDARLALPLPVGVPEWLTPIIAIVPGQLLALGLSEARGIDVDSPRGLNKVTLTE